MIPGQAWIFFRFFVNRLSCSNRAKIMFTFINYGMAYRRSEGILAS